MITAAILQEATLRGATAMTVNQPILSLRGISKSFASVRVLHNVDLDVHPGEVLALLGENGAGKSTLMKIIAGIYRADAGQIQFDGHHVDIRSPRAAQDLGISMIHQELNVLPNRTVAQNVFLGQEPRAAGMGRFFGTVDAKRLQEHSREALTRVGSIAPLGQMLYRLSTAQQQLVEIARTLVSNARVLLMDEPTSSLAEEQSQNLLQLVRDLSDQGIAVVFTTHRLNEALAVADRFVVLRDGEFAGSTTAADVSLDQIVRWMVGRPVSQRFPKREVTPGETVLEVRNLSGGIVKDVSFSVRAGEILGIGGLVGAGRTETARLIFGSDNRVSGEILVQGKKVAVHSPVDAVGAGLGFVPEDRKLQSLVLQMAVRQNMVLAALRSRLSRNGYISGRKVDQNTRHYIERLNIRLRSPSQQVRYLSGGNQQKVVLAKWLMLSPPVLILDEPTRGIDVGAKHEIYELIGDLVEAGVGIVLISSEMPELLGLSDRVVVMAEGRVTAVLDADNATPEAVMTYASVHQPTEPFAPTISGQEHAVEAEKPL
jgi:ABC-type sugar transport system ATPase subunit